MLRTNLGFTLVIVLSLGAGIGANAAIFSVANAVLLRTLPVPEADHLYMVRYQSRLPMTPRFSYPFFEQLRAGFPDPNGIAAMSRVARVRMTGCSRASLTRRACSWSRENSSACCACSRSSDDSSRPKTIAPSAVIPSRSSAMRSGGGKFNGAADAIGRELTLNGARFTIIGVAPPGFAGVWLESPVDVWIPAMMQADVRYTQNFSAENSDMLKPWVPQNGLRWLELVLRADRTDGPEVVALNAVFRPILLQQADRVADPAERQLALDRSLKIEPFSHGSSTLRTQFRTPLFALMAMVALLLLIACANTANLLLARATSRQREMAVRLSIGASRARVMGQLLIESLLLGTIAAAVGLAMAPLASELLVRLTIGVDSGPLPFSVGIDTRVLAFTAIITLLTSMLFGFAPAWRATDLSLSTALKSSGRGTAYGARLSLSKTLVVAQVALSLLLAVGAGLFARSFGNLASLPLGFEPRVLWAAISPSVGGYELPELPALYQRIIERAEALPGVESATIAMCGLMTGCRSAADGLAIDGYVSQPGEQVVLQENRVGPRYFSTVGMSMVAGRDFERARDRQRRQDRDRQRSGGAEVFQRPRSDWPALRVRQARHRDHRRGARRPCEFRARIRGTDGVLSAQFDAVLCRHDAPAHERRPRVHRPRLAQGTAGG